MLKNDALYDTVLFNGLIAFMYVGICCSYDSDVAN